MKRRTIIVLCIAASWILSAGVLLIDRSVVTKGVGFTNLDVDFVVKDEITNEPVNLARIEIISDGGFYDGARNVTGKMDLEADATGLANRRLRGVMFTDSESRLGITRSYHVRIPYWRVRATATGYHDGPWIDLTEQYTGKTQHEGPQFDRLTVRIPLKKESIPQ
jgi:hypothetical protein